MSHAGHLMNLILGEQVVESRVAICMDPSLVLAKVIGGVLALPVRAELVPSCRGITAGPRPPVTQIGPDACGCAFLFGLHFDRRIVSKNGLPLRTCRPMTSASGSSNFVDCPTQPTRVDRSRSIASRPKILDWR